MAKQSTLLLHRQRPRGTPTESKREPYAVSPSIHHKQSKKDKHLPRGNGHQVPTCCLLRCTGSDRNGCTALTQRIATVAATKLDACSLSNKYQISIKNKNIASSRENSLSEWLFRVFCFEYPVNNWSFAFDDVPENRHYSSYLVYAVCARPPTAKGY